MADVALARTAGSLTFGKPPSAAHRLVLTWTSTRRPAGRTPGGATRT